jgi:hypothetical protein
MKLFLFTVLMTFFVLFSCPISIGAQEYKIKPYIAVPNDYDSNEDVIGLSLNTGNIDTDIESRFHRTILNALADVQEYFARQTNGKTFNFNKNITVTHLPGNTEQLKGKSLSLCTIFSQLGGDQVIPENKRTVSVIWILGLPSNPFFAGCTSGFSENPNVIIPSQFLTALEKPNPIEKTDGLQVLAHELGHAFGLSFGGYAKGHTCSNFTREDWCQPNSPLPLPSTQEGLKALMFPSVRERRSLYEAVIYNTIHNPEISQLYKSPFINPEGSPGPEPEQFNQDENDPTITSIILPFDNENSTISEGDTIKIIGKNFGKRQGSVEFYNANYTDQSFYQKTIQSWTDTAIIVHIDNVHISHDTNWNISIIESEEGLESNPININLKGNSSEAEETIRKPTTINFSVTCTNDTGIIHLSGITVSIKDELNNTILSAVSQNSDVSMSFYQLEGKHYRLINDSVYENFKSSPEYWTISDIPGTATGTHSFHYDRCPNPFNNIKSRDNIVSIIVNGERWDTSSPSFLLHLPGTDGEQQVFSVPIVITYTNGKTKTIDLNFNYDPNADLKSFHTSCHYNEEFTDEFHGCANGTRKCSGISDGKNCIYDASGNVDPNCKVISCASDSDFQPETTTAESDNSSSEIKEANEICADGEFKGCVENSCGIEYWICDGVKDKYTSPPDGDCRNPNMNNVCGEKQKCEEKHYYDENATPQDGIEKGEKGVCIHKLPLPENPKECAFVQEEYNNCQ